MSSQSIQYPLLFNYRDCIAGDGFLAAVLVSGRALMLNEDDEWWMYGVQPSAIAEAGETPQEAANHFRNRYKTVLFDFAAEASGFEAFKAEVERFFNQQETHIAASWHAAFQLIRSGEVEPEEPFSRLPREAPEAREPEIQVCLVDPAALSPSDNMLDRELIAA